MDKPLPPYQERESYKAHKRDLTRQILLPMIIVLILAIIASVFTTMRPAADASLWADISIIWLLIPLLFSALISIIFFGGLVYGMSKLLKITPVYSLKLYNLIRLLTKKISDAADASTKPIFFIEGISASIKGFLQPK